MILTSDHRLVLIETARRAIEYGLDHGSRPAFDHSLYPQALLSPAATFVTLEKVGQLRGCIGKLEAERPLAEDVAENAYSAAFHDPRFAPVSYDEWRAVEIHISVLSAPVALDFNSEPELIAQLRPGLDGLILKDGRHRATFLPSVWTSLPEPRNFVAQLKIKAGFGAAYWSDSLEAFRYETESFRGAPKTSAL
ncbi:MAG: AmmeMemoRadiSam system protein A [Pseudomonadota bacterium]